MKLYSGPLSLFTAKVRIALAEKALDYERVEVAFSRAEGYEPKHPDVVALNPKAVLVHLDAGRAEVRAVSDLLKRLDVLHTSVAIDAVVIGRGYLPVG